jgi:hypothetical protein
MSSTSSSRHAHEASPYEGSDLPGRSETIDRDHAHPTDKDPTSVGMWALVILGLVILAIAIGAMVA